jgi:hypothetical protein
VRFGYEPPLNVVLLPDHLLGFGQSPGPAVDKRQRLVESGDVRVAGSERAVGQDGDVGFDVPIAHTKMSGTHGGRAMSDNRQEMIMMKTPLARRLTLGAAALALVAGATAMSPAATARPEEGSAAPADLWLKTANVKHRQLFDSPAPNGGIPLVHILNYYDTWNKAYGVADKDIRGIGTFYGATTFFGVNDAMWNKYQIGEFLGEKDAAGKAATANPWRTTPVVLGMSLPQASIESLQKRGASFILCNNALTIFSGALAKARGLEADAVYRDLKANILPGVELIPGMVVAIEQAQAAGISYHRQ